MARRKSRRAPPGWWKKDRRGDRPLGRVFLCGRWYSVRDPDDADREAWEAFGLDLIASGVVRLDGRSAREALEAWQQTPEGLDVLVWHLVRDEFCRVMGRHVTLEEFVQESRKNGGSRVAGR